MIDDKARLVALSFKVPADLIERVDAETAREMAAHPGLVLARTQTLRVLLEEALAARAKVRAAE